MLEVFELVRSGRGQSRRVVGEAGIGKSALIASALARAGEMLVVSTRAVAGEEQLPFSALGDVVRPLGEHLADVPCVQRAALEGALALAPPTPADRYAAYAGFLNLLAAAASERPLLIVVDDVQWADRTSAEALLYAARRIGDDPIGIVMGQRAGESTAAVLEGVATLELGGLDVAAAKTLVRSVNDGIAEAVLEELVAHSGGNPLALLEIPKTLSEAQLAGTSSLPLPLGAGAELEEHFGRRLGEQLSSTALTAAAVAAASMGGDEYSIRRALRALEIPDGALQEVEAAGFLALGSRTVEFRHPLVRSAAAQRLPAAERREVHRALASSLAEEHVVERAVHRSLAAEGADEELAAELSEAASTSMARGAHTVAANLMRRSVEVSAEGPDLLERTGMAAGASFLSGDLPGARQLLERALASSPPDPMRARLEHQLGTVDYYLGDTERVLPRLESTGSRIADAMPGEAAPILADATTFATAAGDMRAAVRLGALARATGRRSGDPAVAANADAADCHARLSRGEPAGAELDSTAAALEQVAAPGSPSLLRLVVLGLCTTWDGRPRDALALLSPLVTSARASSDMNIAPIALAFSGHARLESGEVERALAELTEALHLGTELGQHQTALAARFLRARVYALRGDLAVAEEEAQRALEMALHMKSGMAILASNDVLARVDLLRGASQKVVDRAVPLLAATWDQDAMEHPGPVPIAGDLVEALIMNGDVERARGVQERFARQSAHAESTVGQGFNERMAGQIAAHSGGNPHDRFSSSVQIFADIGNPFEEGRSRLGFGEYLARDGKADPAIEQLRRARDSFGELGASQWLRRTERGLRGLGVSTEHEARESPPELTPHERQVADLVVDGLKNDEIAEQLFVTRRTVESHLTSVYRKLGIERRTQLARALRRPPRASSG